MTHWIRYEYKAKVGFGVLENDTIIIYNGNMFSNPKNTGKRISLSNVKVLSPTEPKKMPALWNNYHEMAEKAGNKKPTHPLYFFKSPSSFSSNGETINRPVGYEGRVVYEGEVGIVIGKSCHLADKLDAAEAIFGYTCINDITAADIIDSDPSFAQWTRSKGFDGFGVFGPVIATNVDPNELRVRTILNGEERQNYLVSDMIIPPVEIVRLLSFDMALEPGDVICCGTNIGVGSMKEEVNDIEISIEGIGSLTNVYKN